MYERLHHRQPLVAESVSFSPGSYQHCRDTRRRVSQKADHPKSDYREQHLQFIEEPYTGQENHQHYDTVPGAVSKFNVVYTGLVDWMGLKC